MSETETRSRVLRAAVEMLESDGLTVSFDSLSMEKAIAAAGVSRASAYRRWPNRQDFLADVLAAAVERKPMPESERDLAALRALVAEFEPELHTEQGRRDLVVEALRQASDFDVRRLLSSRTWQNGLALAATHGGLPAGGLKDSVGRALDRAEEQMVGIRAGVYAHLLDVLGYRLVPPLEGEQGLRIMSSAAGVTMTGVLMRLQTEPAWLEERTPLTLFGASREAPWSMPEIHLVTMFLAHLEPDPAVVWGEARMRESLRLLDERVEAARSARGESGGAAEGEVPATV